MAAQKGRKADLVNARLQEAYEGDRAKGGALGSNKRAKKRV